MTRREKPADHGRRDRGHRRELERSKRRWDFWSSHWGLIERDTVEIRRETVEQLGVEPGDTVLDLGCGPGVNLAMLREAVGPGGQVIGLDLSRKMLDRARTRLEERGWQNVSLVQADATAPHVQADQLDGVLATTAVSATPDVRSTVRNVSEALCPGGRFALYDIRLVPAGPGTVLNPVVRRFYRLFGNWNDEESVLDELHAAFDRTELVRSFALGTNYIAVAENRREDPGTG
ncbi:class I SAM-dependent methyltransferase [Haloarchaeobius amylolyticus]|uniref:class I SAM-dependent methyltransferase n=1 Tax=Haloarchaeobius amylolyticus TaxID=1198296 RepID=UPI00226D75D7|nr:methyltransferase domain-containing protein [Haloarchaeobius amylolyticus]